MPSHPNEDEFEKKRHDEERKLINEIRRKRKYIKVAPSFPSEDDIQSKIRRFLCIIIDLTRSSDLAETFASISGKKPQFFARMEATLYKCRLERVHLEACNTAERIRSAAEGLSMAYELYSLLVLTDNDLSDSRHTFFGMEEQGVPLEPKFTADFVRRELDFYENFCQSIAIEIRDAELQMRNEVHESVFDQIKEIIVGFQHSLDEKFDHLQQQISRQNEQIERLADSLKAIQESVSVIESQISTEGADEHPPVADAQSILHDHGEPKRMQEHDEVEHPPEHDVPVHQREHQEPKHPRESEDKAPEEAVADVAEENAFEPNEERPAENNRGARERRELETRLQSLRAFIHSRHVPERKINYENNMRYEERFLRCSFCFAKGMHYSDSCPEVVSVEARNRRIRCERCLNLLHETEDCTKKEKKCMYCGSKAHNKALCTLPERIRDCLVEIEEIERELEINADYYGLGQSNSRH